MAEQRTLGEELEERLRILGATRAEADRFLARFVQLTTTERMMLVSLPDVELTAVLKHSRSTQTYDFGWL